MIDESQPIIKKPTDLACALKVFNALLLEKLVNTVHGSLKVTTDTNNHTLA